MSNIQTDITAARVFARRTLNELLAKKLVKKIDNAVFVYTRGDVQQYNKQIYNLYGIVSASCNNKTQSDIISLLDDLERGCVGVDMSHFEKFREQQQIDDSKYDIDVDVADGAVSCSKCGSSKVFQHHKQTRSADEATTIFYTCANKACTKRWRVG